MSSEQNFTLGGKSRLLPQEEMLEVKRDKKKLIIGVPREVLFEENRVALVPGAVNLLVQNGHEVVIETDAGKSAKFPDNEYSEAGATIAYEKADVFKADIVIKVAPLSHEEIDLLAEHSTVFSALHYVIQNEDYFKRLSKKKVTAFASDWIKDDSGNFPVLRSLSEISGNASILIAAEYLSSMEYGRASMFGSIAGITPTEVVIIGAGTVGEYAARGAMAFGAQIKIFDNSVYKLRRIQKDLGSKIFTSIIQPKVLKKALLAADVVIGAVHSKHGRTPCYISEDMVSQMKDGAVIIDVSIDQGGCFETSNVTTHSNPVFVKHGVTHYCVPNIPSMVPHTASYALSNFYGPLMVEMGEEGGIENLIRVNKGVRHGAYMFNGRMTSSILAKQFNMPYSDLNLLMAAFH